MGSWKEYRETARSRGAPAIELYVVFSTPLGSPALIQEQLPAHLSYQLEQEKLGNLVLAGPVSDTGGESVEGMGLIVYRADSLAAAAAFADADPMHRSGARRYELRRWMINEGTLSSAL